MKELIVDKNVIKTNLAAVREKAAGLSIMAVVKSDAYGLGLSGAVELLYAEGVRRFGVCLASEAAVIRQAGYGDVEILMLRSISHAAEIEQLLDLGVTATIGSQEAAMALSGLAERRSTVAEAQIKIDTGFGRYGFLPSEMDKIFGVYQYLGNLAITGIYTQYNSQLSRKALLRQAAAFDTVLAGLRERRMETGTVHAAGSTVLFTKKDVPLYDMVRVGAALGASGLPRGSKTGLGKAAKLHAQIEEVRWLPARSPVSGGKRLRKAARVGVVPVGYADGFAVQKPPSSKSSAYRRLMRELWAKPRFLRTAEGKKLRLLGRVGQTHLALDLSSSDAGAGTDVYAEVIPLFCGRLPIRYV
ncbi:MAG: alanine racemase [Oscillospiraceae bacterium]|jgi:alanine racemase|nr:alanine racemase [Oscillospiraceae bacterium]